MNSYLLRYISGPQGRLRVSREELVLAESLDKALLSKSFWPIERNLKGDCGWAKNPGTSLYDVEAWEVTRVA
jgi:hypothetical protein